jgi:hypothetical protein
MNTTTTHTCTKGQAETLKYIGLATMVIDHFGQFLKIHAPAWELIGCAAMPAFALALGTQLKQSSAWRACKRLGYAGVVILPFYYWACWPTQTHPDILLGLACACAWIAADDSKGAKRYAIKSLAFLAAFASDFGQTGIALAMSARAEKAWQRYAWLALGTVGLYMWNGPLGAGYGIAWYAAARYLPEAPRREHLFLRAYMIQWPLIGAARALGA